eukprot:1158573-Pelagomonas_calceolata.AAC.4
MMMGSVQPVPESTLWRYVVQLAGALRAVHSAGLALRPACLHPTKVRAGLALLESTLWRYVVQLAGAVRAAHSAGLAPSVLASHKVQGL